jgi:pSer/pThr/pTyr-binding forkhead associated (FHA) protein
MPPTRVTLTVIRGSLKGKEYAFEGPVLCMIGRGEDCDIHLPTDFAHADVSRHHCLLDIASSHVRIRDLGSRNGTFVNERTIGQRPLHLAPEEADLSSSKTVELRDGDEIRVGNTVLRCSVFSSHTPESAYFPVCAAYL